MAGLQCWNMDRDILDQYETFNGMPVYYGGDMYDSEDSDWDDPYALASAAYVEDYNFDVPEGMDLMVHRRNRIPDSSDAQQDGQTDVAPVCQTVSCVPRNESDVFDDDSLTEAADADGLNMDDFNQRVVSSDDEDFVNSDNGSITDLDRDISDEDDCCDSDDRDMSEEEDFVTSDVGSFADLDRDMSDREDCCDSDVGSGADLKWDTWADACTLAFQGAVGAFPPEAAEIWPAVVFGNSLFPGDECANAVVSVQRDVPISPVLRVLPVLQVTNKRVAMIPPVTDRHVQRTVARSVGWGTYSVRLCLLYPNSTEDIHDLRSGSVESQRLNHWHTVTWDPGIVDSRALSVCYDCLCLMVLFRAVMSLARYWAVEFVWTGPDEGSCRSIAWDERYFPRLHPPCVVDRLCGYMTEIISPGICPYA